MAIRKRFTKAEAALFTEGVLVEWQNGSHWRTGVIIGPPDVDSLGDAYLPVRDTGPTTRTISSGAYVRPAAGQVRLSRSTAHAPGNRVFHGDDPDAHGTVQRAFRVARAGVEIGTYNEVAWDDGSTSDCLELELFGVM